MVAQSIARRNRYCFAPLFDAQSWPAISVTGTVSAFCVDPVTGEASAAAGDTAWWFFWNGYKSGLILNGPIIGLGIDQHGLVVSACPI